MNENRYLSYKGYKGSVEYSAEDHILHGKVLGIRDLVSFEGNSVEEITADFKETIDEYLAVCEAEGIAPDKPYKGSFSVRISPELHIAAATYAKEHGISMNRVVSTAIHNLVTN